MAARKPAVSAAGDPRIRGKRNSISLTRGGLELQSAYLTESAKTLRAKAVFDMFVKKLIAAMLLAIYGIPTAVGPHWHHHHHVGDACAAESQPASGCCCHHTPAVSDADETDSGPAFTADSPREVGGLCAICQFYGSASLRIADARVLESSRLAVAIVALPQSLSLPSLLACHVRGPPSAWA